VPNSSKRLKSDSRVLTRLRIASFADRQVTMPRNVLLTLTEKLLINLHILFVKLIRPTQYNNYMEKTEPAPPDNHAMYEQLTQYRISQAR
jgi:hypothetical protein